jgi:restriction system protein
VEMPRFDDFAPELLKLASDGQAHRIRDAYASLADVFGLTQEQRQHLLPSGQQLMFHNRIGWARSYLKKAGLLTSPRRGYFLITERGKQFLSAHGGQVSKSGLMNVPEIQAFKNRKHNKVTAFSNSDDGDATVDTPLERLENAHDELREALVLDLLEQINSVSPSFFEQLVVDLLLAMGYGGSIADAGQVLGRSGDEGIDGVIKEDRLGLDMVYIQAKRWANIVGRPEIQRFVGALQGKRAKKGVFLSTSSFSAEAIRYVDTVDAKVVLIDGDRLASLMIEYDVGVSREKSYIIKRIDTDYFSEE